MRAAVRGPGAEAYPPAALRAWASLPPLYHAWAMTAGGEAYLVAEEGRRIVAYAALRGREVTALFVHPSRARRGLGRALLARLAARARRAGLSSLTVKAAEGAVPFYARTGFAGARRLAVPLPGGPSLPARAMRRPL